LYPRRKRNKGTDAKQNSNNSHLTIASLNMKNSLGGQEALVLQLIEKCAIDVLCIQEAGVKTAVKHVFKDYHVFEQEFTYTSVTVNKEKLLEAESSQIVIIKKENAFQVDYKAKNQNQESKWLHSEMVQQELQLQTATTQKQTLHQTSGTQSNMLNKLNSTLAKSMQRLKSSVETSIPLVMTGMQRLSEQTKEGNHQRNKQ
jgi:hypothetical protein